MHFSAKRGLDIALSSVCTSVTLMDCDYIGLNSLKIISRLVSLPCSLSADPNIRDYSKGNTLKLGSKVTHPSVDLIVGDIRSQIAAEWLQIAQQSQWRANRKPPSLFRIVPSWPPISLPRNGWGSICPNIREWPYLHNRLSDPFHVLF